MARWQKQFEEIRYQHRSVLRPDEIPAELPEDARLELARSASLPLLAAEFSRRAVLESSAARITAAKGLIASGIKSADDVNKISASYRERGVLHDGELVPLVWGKVEETGRVGITTGLHIEREAELIALVQAAHRDRSAALPAGAIERAIEASGLDFTSEHGQRQREIVEQIAAGSRWHLTIGVAGAGKTAMLSPLVAAWKEDARQVYGTGLAWRYAKRLTESGIDEDKTFAIRRFIAMASEGKLQLDRNTVLVIDEVSTAGTRQMLSLARLQAAHGFQLVALGDDKQAQSIAAGPVIDLMRRALGPDQVPEILTTLRQFRERDRKHHCCSAMVAPLKR